jgi:hypothetical protein
MLDDGVMRDYIEEVDTVLVFVRRFIFLFFANKVFNLMFKAGLFSAILTAFIIEVYKGLQEDASATSVEILRRISMQLDGATDNLIRLPETFAPSGTSIAVNALWFSSLSLSLFAALLGIFAKQWLHVYSKWPDREQPKDTLILRDFYQEAFVQWRVPDIIGMLPVLLQIALLLFTLGLVAYMWTLNIAVASVLTTVTTIMIFLVIVTVVLPVFYRDCPYKSPLGLFIAAFQTKYSDSSHDQASVFANWHRGDLHEAKRRLEANSLDGITAQSALILDIYPRTDVESALKNSIPNDSLLGSRISGLPENMLRVLLDRVITTTEKTDYVNSQRATHSVHLLDYISHISKEEICRGAALAIANIDAPLDSSLGNTCLEIIWRMLQEDMKKGNSRLSFNLRIMC